MPPLLPEPVRRTAAWCVVILLVTGVAAVGVWLCVVLQTAVTPVLLALLGAALLRPLFRRLVRARVNRSLAAGLTCVAVVGVVGGAVYVVVASLVDNGDQIIASLKQAGTSVSRHFGPAGTSLGDVAGSARKLLSKFGATAASGVISGLSVVAEWIATGILALLLVFFFLRDGGHALRALRVLSPGEGGAVLEAMARRAFGAVEGFSCAAPR